MTVQLVFKKNKMLQTCVKNELVDTRVQQRLIWGKTARYTTEDVERGGAHKLIPTTTTSAHGMHKHEGISTQKCKPQILVHILAKYW